LDIRDNFPSQSPAQSSERTRCIVSENHDVTRLKRDDKISFVTPNTNLSLWTRQHRSPLFGRLKATMSLPLTDSTGHVDKSLSLCLLPFYNAGMPPATKRGARGELRLAARAAETAVGDAEKIRSRL
jgi:hypothetical protein